MPTTSTFSPSCATIDLSALAYNLSQFRRILVPGCHILAVVKANAYGHGAVEVARALIRHGVARVAVVSIEEGIALRQAGINAPIIVLGPLFQDQIQEVIAHQLTPVLSDRSVLPALARATTLLPTPYPIHVKIDTGMGRLGLADDEVLSLIESSGLPPSLQLEGLMTHLADTDGERSDYTEAQLVRFNQTIKLITARGLRIPLIHATNSGGAVRFPRAQFTMVRPGIMLYGYHTLPPTVPVPDLKPVLSLRTCVAQLRTIPAGGSVSYNRTFVAKQPTRVAVLPIGYADGFSRRLSNVGHVLIHGKRAPVVGTVCMDMVLVDVTAIPGVMLGDDVVVIGRQGQDEITANDLAAWTGTIPYEVLCSIGPRVPRQYHTS